MRELDRDESVRLVARAGWNPNAELDDFLEEFLAFLCQVRLRPLWVSALEHVFLTQAEPLTDQVLIGSDDEDAIHIRQEIANGFQQIEGHIGQAAIQVIDENI